MNYRPIKDVKQLDPKARVKVTLFKNKARIEYLSSRSKGNQSSSRIKGKFAALPNSTSQELSHKFYTSRHDDLIGVRSCLKKLRNLIDNNVTDKDKCLFITLTYSTLMRDSKKFSQDLKRFYRRVKNTYGSCEYIAVREPHANGSWHAHVYYIFPEHIPVDCNFEQLWEHGNVTIKDIYDEKALPFYFTLGNLKKKDKLDRLKLHPASFAIYSTSIRVEKPPEFFCINKEADEILSDYTLTQKYACEIIDPNRGNFKAEYHSYLYERQ